MGSEKRKDFLTPLSEHPTPQFRRESFLCLNGKWDFEINQKRITPSIYTKTIVVPFSVETKSSWINERITENDVMHYRKIFSVPKNFLKGRNFLHFEGVDQVCDIYFNGIKVGHHEGGYQSFVIELTNVEEERNVLQVDVIDNTDSPFYPRGKQSNKPKGIWYHPTSGIWQTVWLESTPKEYIKNLAILDSFDEKFVGIKVSFDGNFAYGDISLLKDGKVYEKINLTKDLYCKINLFGIFHPWSPETPFLYDFKININGDEVYSYFAIRKISCIEKDGFKVFALNNKPLFLAGALDQGYYGESGLTPSSDIDMIRDIKLAKSFGFNFIRKHIKIEPMRYYYHCDRLGMLVMQDMVNMGTSYSKFLIVTAPFISYHFDDTNSKTQKRLGMGLRQSRHTFIDECKQTISRLINCPSIFSWTIFNEGWGQFNSKKVYEELRRVDSSRLFDANSGWFDQGVGNFNSKHIYFKKIRPSNDHKRILLISEFGGYSLPIDGHREKKIFGYKLFKNKEDFAKGITDLFQKDLGFAHKKAGIAGFVYTQLFDVETEVNGLVTSDREVIKVDPELIKRLINYFTFNQ